MIRFIDLRGQATGYRFAFWDTVVDQFLAVGTEQAWDTRADLEECLRISPSPCPPERLLDLLPGWADEEPGEAEMFD